MITKFKLVRILLIFLLVIILPIVQNQWQNLYYYNLNNFTIYKFLYYLSGLILPIIVCIISLNNFTYYKFGNSKIINNQEVNGKSLFITTLITLITISTLISGYIFINLKIFFNSIILDNKYLIEFDSHKLILSVFIISILLIFKKIKILIKKIILLNFFIISTFIWYANINDIFFNDIYLINNFLKFENINSINIYFLLSLEIIYYIWSYISNGTNLSDWSISLPDNSKLRTILNITVFYMMIILYYSILSK